MKMTMAQKVIILFMVGGLLPFIAIGLISYNTASTSLKEQAMNQLTSVREMKKDALEKYFANRVADIKALASSSMTLSALKGLKLYYADLGREEARKLYVHNNPHPLGQKHELIDAQDGSTYSMLHARYHPYFKYYLEEYKYFYDLFLVDAETGELVYTVFKEDDYGTNLYNGKYKNSNIGELARAINISQDNNVQEIDFRPYEPSNGEPARFLACPILDEDGVKEGILILQLSIEAIDNVMTARAGLGETGEAYLVGPDKLMRSNSRFSKEPTVLNLKIDTISVNEALNGSSGTQIIEDYRGIPVLSAYAPLKVGEWTWAIIAEIDRAEALAPAITLRNKMFMLGIVITLGVAALGYLVTKIAGRVSNLLKNLLHDLSEGSANIASASVQISASSQSLSEGTTQQAAAVEETSSSMEEMASMTKHNADNAKEAAQLAILCSKSAKDGSKSMVEMDVAMIEIDKSSKKISEIIKTIDSIASQTDTLALNAAGEAAKAVENGKGFAVVAGEVRNLAQRSTAATKDTASLIQDSLGKTKIVTELAKGCTNSFRNIAANINNVIALVNKIATSSHEQTQDKGQTSGFVHQIEQALRDCAVNAEKTVAAGEELESRMKEVNQSNTRISESINTIDMIAFQTNMLALNAAVEAARADEHGRGFALLGDEVRALAQRTGVAAKDTASLIQDSIQKADAGTALVKKCSGALQEIVVDVKKMSVLVNEIAAASDEQSQGADQISRAIQQIDQALQNSAANAEEAASTAEELSAQSQVLKELVSKIAKEVGGGNGNGRVKQEKHVSSPAPAVETQTPVRDGRDTEQLKMYDRLNQELFYNEINYDPTKEDNNGDEDSNGKSNKIDRTTHQPSDVTMSSVGNNDE